jgi:hypothetical protein
MVYQYYVVEIQQYQDGTYGHIVHYAYDEDPDKARMKGESKYYEVLSAAAISELPSHAAILFSAEGFPIDHKCYKHTTNVAETAEPETETPTEE